MDVKLTNGNLAAAIAYAEAGAAVLPLHTPRADGTCSCMRRDCTAAAKGPVGKHPRTLNGKDDATSDVETVRRWGSMWPDANWGVRPAPGVFVLDVDPRNGGGTSLLNLERTHCRLRPTQTAATGGGGLHIWLAYDGPVRASLGPGLDVKTHSGYVVMPPSLHVSGRRYSWVNEHSGIQPAPQWLVELLTPPTVELRGDPNVNTATPARAEALLKVVREAQEGERNARLYWACCRAAECGLDPAPLVAAAVAVGLPEWEATNTARSAARSVEGVAA